MSHFTFPSDQDRADNDELERVCDQLEQCLVEDERLRDALAERDNLVDTYREKLEKAEARSKSLTQHLEEAQQERNVTGLQISAALRGGKRKDEAPNDGRMEAVRAMVAQVERLRKALGGLLGELQPSDGWSPLDLAKEHAETVETEVPAQSLGAVRAEAVEAFANHIETDPYETTKFSKMARKYAQQLRAGGDNE